MSDEGQESKIPYRNISAPWHLIEQVVELVGVLPQVRIGPPFVGPQFPAPSWRSR